MSDNIKNGTTEKETGETQQHRCRGKRPGRVVRGIFGVFALVGIISVGGAVFGSSYGHAHGGHMWGNPSIEEMSERMTERLLNKIDATDEQSVQIKTIVKQYQPQLESMKGMRDTNRNMFKQVLTQGTVNTNELEVARVAAFNQLNNNSVVITQMFGEIANVLTQEQRVELIDTFESHHRPW